MGMTLTHTTMLAAALALLMAGAACSPTIRPTAPAPSSPEQRAQFWVDGSVESRDLFGGPDPSLAAAVDATYTFVGVKEGGFSPGFDVKDAAGLEWSVKLGQEAKPEVVASRLVWAMGYHQFPITYVPRWTLAGGESPGPQSAGRFRPKLPDYRKVDEWSWHENPFVGTQPYRGLLVLMAMLNNSDLKPAQNAIFEVTGEREGPRRLYMVMDLGQSFGATGLIDAPRGDANAFEKHGFIERIEGERVKFVHHGSRAELFDQITPGDLRWMSDRLSRLTDAQWADAFRAAAYHPTESERFIRRMKEKIDQGLRGVPDPPRRAN